MTHEQPLALVAELVNRLQTRYQYRISAIGLCGSIARQMDGPYSDIELHCILTEQAEQLGLRIKTPHNEILP